MPGRSKKNDQEKKTVSTANVPAKLTTSRIQVSNVTATSACSINKLLDLQAKFCQTLWRALQNTVLVLGVLYNVLTNDLSGPSPGPNESRPHPAKLFL
jgi:hypothetical protein